MLRPPPHVVPKPRDRPRPAPNYRGDDERDQRLTSTNEITRKPFHTAPADVTRAGGASANLVWCNIHAVQRRSGSPPISAPRSGGDCGYVGLGALSPLAGFCSSSAPRRLLTVGVALVTRPPCTGCSGTPMVRRSAHQSVLVHRILVSHSAWGSGDLMRNKIKKAVTGVATASIVGATMLFVWAPSAMAEPPGCSSREVGSTSSSGLLISNAYGTCSASITRVLESQVWQDISGGPDKLLAANGPQYTGTSYHTVAETCNGGKTLRYYGRAYFTTNETQHDSPHDIEHAC